MDCNTCLDSKFITGDADRTPWSVIEKKATERAAWSTLPYRLPKMACPDCTVKVDLSSKVDLSAAFGQSAAGDPPKRRGRGRPFGSKNKPKA